jgi:hypothetical protein
VGGEFARQLVAGRDLELLEDVSEVGLDGSLGDEEALCDLAVGRALGREPGDAELAGRQGLDTGEDGPARTAAGGEELLAGALRERCGTCAVSELEAMPQAVARLCSMTLTAER